MTRRLTDLQVLHALVIEVAPVIPSRDEALSHPGPANPSRAAWQAALSHLGLTEAQVRDGAALVQLAEACA